jgi:predicted DNA-binding transcriptional regulator AlpA
MRGSSAVSQKKPRGEWLDMKRAAKKSGMSKEWIYKRMKSGTLPFNWHLKSSGKRVIDSADIDDWHSITEIPAGTTPGNI